MHTITLQTPYITLALPQLTPDLVAGARVWLQCRMGLCSATQAGARGNIKRCVDPELVCAAPEAERGRHAESSLQQVTVRGPLHVAPVSRRDRARDPHVSVAQLDPTKPNQDPAFTATTSHTLVEVPVEVAVAIALASFIVGAMSTGVLWFLHSRAMQAKAVSAAHFLHIITPNTVLTDTPPAAETEAARRGPGGASHARAQAAARHRGPGRGHGGGRGGGRGHTRQQQLHGVSPALACSSRSPGSKFLSSSRSQHGAI